MKAVKDFASAVSALQRLVKPVRGLVGTVSVPQKLVNAGRGATSTVSTPQLPCRDLVSAVCTLQGSMSKKKPD